MTGSSRRDFLRIAGMLTALPAFSFASPLNIEEKPKKIFPALHTGETVGIVCPAGAIFDKKSLEEFIKILEGLSFKVVLGKTTSLRTGYFAGTDKERAQDVMEMFSRKDIRAIFCAKGGWGSARILPFLDYEIIQNNPKVFIGFSDITILLNVITQKSGLITFHGPVGNSSWNDFSVASFKNCVLEKKKQLVVFNADTRAYSGGEASGPLYGGNLSVLCSLLGTPWLPDLQGSILLLEETTEEPYRIDRMLTQLDQAGIFEKVKGIVFGKCAKCVAEEPDKAFTLEEVFVDHFSERKIPIISGLPFGHTGDKLTLPLGCVAKISTISRALTLSVES